MITPPALHVALDTLRRDVHDMVPGAVEPLDAVDRRRMVPGMRVRVWDVMHLHCRMVRPAHRHPCLGALRGLWGLLRGRGRRARHGVSGLPSVPVGGLAGLACVRVGMSVPVPVPMHAWHGVRGGERTSVIVRAWRGTRVRVWGREMFHRV